MKTRVRMSIDTTTNLDLTAMKPKLEATIQNLIEAEGYEGTVKVTRINEAKPMPTSEEEA